MRVLLILVLSAGLGSTAILEPKNKFQTVECEFYDALCVKEKRGNCTGTKRCDQQPEAEDGEEAFCFTVWQNHTEAVEGRTGTHVKKQGCVFNHGGSQERCRNYTECVEESDGNKNHLFCCCTGNSCNKEFRWEPVIVETTLPPPLLAPQPSSQFYLLIYSIVPLLVLFVIGLAGAYIYRQRKSSHFSSLSQCDDGPVSPPTPTFTHKPVQLLEIKARGRFGAVWKGQLGGNQVAVKIFPLQDKQSWIAEQGIYNLPQMSHENILNFIGVDRRGENLQQEFWLVTAFHEQGSLCDYLKVNTVTLEELTKITCGIAAGLNHLHTEMPGIRGADFKPAIAHRDFKSKNVLIKADKTACIGDFGLALPFNDNDTVGDTHGQVGTRRYMAPEVLEGAINFSRDAFLRIDMYACGLVLWEVLSRCTGVGNVGFYRLPFDAESSPHPTMEEITENVVTKKVRPVLKDIWWKHSALGILCETIEECWDHDAEARLSASCVQERVSVMRSVINNYNNLDDEEVGLVSQENRNNSLNNQLSTQFMMQPIRTNIHEEQQ